MIDKLNIVVRVDLDYARAQISAKGHLTCRNIQGLYAVLQRANSLGEGLDLEIDITRARIEPDALEQLTRCCQSRHLPLELDPLQADCRFSLSSAAVPAAA